MTEDIQKMKERTIIAKDIYLTTGSIMAKNNYAALKKSYDNHIKQGKENQVQHQIHNAANQTKEIWRIINQERKRNTTEDQNITPCIDAKLETEPQRIADHFNSYFISIGQKADTEESNQNNFTNQIPDSRETTKWSNFKTITEENLIQIIKKH